jgi:peptidyl-tRNA hydrolase, PTH2 family
MREVKQVIVMRKDLKMRRGKEIAQGSHASMSFITRQLQNSNVVKLSDAEKQWIDSSFAKVCVRVDSEEQLMEIAQRAKEAMLECHVITDSGRTEFGGVPTKTCLAIGPDYSDKINKVTGDLELY